VINMLKAKIVRLHGKRMEVANKNVGDKGSLLVQAGHDEHGGTSDISLDETGGWQWRRGRQ
jgi:hypothetical protein